MRKVTGYRLQVTVRLILSLLLTLFFFLYPIPYTLYPTYAQSPSGVPIGKFFGFGDIKTLGEGTSRLVGPIFSVAVAVVVLYFLFGAFFYLKSTGDKEELENARKMITHAIIGFILLIFAFLVLQFLLSSLFGITDFQIIK